MVVLMSPGLLRSVRMDAAPAVRRKQYDDGVSATKDKL
jgi:hypothetical protein